VPAVDFHYPDSGFKRGTPHTIAGMADEAVQVSSDRKLYLLFSQLQNNDDDLLIAELRARGWAVVRDERYIGTRAVYLGRPPFLQSGFGVSNSSQTLVWYKVRRDGHSAGRGIFLAG